MARPPIASRKMTPYARGKAKPGCSSRPRTKKPAAMPSTPPMMCMSAKRRPRRVGGTVLPSMSVHGTMERPSLTQKAR